MRTSENVWTGVCDCCAGSFTLGWFRPEGKPQELWWVGFHGHIMEQAQVLGSVTAQRRDLWTLIGRITGRCWVGY